MRLQPTAAPPPACTFHCLRSTSIALRDRTVKKAHVINGTVTVQDENGAPIPAALVVGRWTHPAGEYEQYAWTGSNGLAAFDIRGAQGTYTLTVLNIVLSLYTFDPGHSVLVSSVTTSSK